MEAGGVRLVARTSADRGSSYEVEAKVTKTAAGAFSEALRRDTAEEYRTVPSPAAGRERGTVERSFAAYLDAEGYLGFPIFNPLESDGSLVRTNADGSPAEEGEEPARHAGVLAVGSAGGVDRAVLAAAYVKNHTALTVYFELNAKGEKISYRVTDPGMTVYTAELLSATNGVEALLITNAGEPETTAVTGTSPAGAPGAVTAPAETPAPDLFHAEAYFVKNGIFCAIHASGEEQYTAEIRRTLMLAVNLFGASEE